MSLSHLTITSTERVDVGGGGGGNKGVGGIGDGGRGGGGTEILGAGVIPKFVVFY